MTISVSFGNSFAAPQGKVQARKLVVIESPFASNDPQAMRDNVAYAQKAMTDSLYFHDEAPMLSHLLYTQVLNEDDATARDMGIKAGLAWRQGSQGTVVYKDRGISHGMGYGIAAAQEVGKSVEYRSLETCGHKAQVEQLYQEAQNRSRGLGVNVIA